jgi:hypothetical protein
MHGLVRSQERHPGHPGRVVNFFVSIGIQHLEDLFSLVAMKASAQGLHMVSLTKWMFRKNKHNFSYPVVKGRHAIHARLRSLKPHKLQNQY